MDLLWFVPSDGFVGPDVVVLDAVLLGVFGEDHGIVDFVDEQPLLL